MAALCLVLQASMLLGAVTSSAVATPPAIGPAPDGTAPASSSPPTSGCLQTEEEPQRCETWAVEHDPTIEDDVIAGTAASPDGQTIFVAGTVQTASEGSAIDVVAIASEDGSTRWTSTWDSSDGSENRALDLAVSPGGDRVYVTGTVLTTLGRGEGEMEDDRDILTIAFDATDGAVEWVSTWSGPAPGLDGAKSIVPSPDGREVYVGGYAKTEPSEGAYDLLLLALDAHSGDTAWVRLYDGPAEGNEFDGPSQFGLFDIQPSLLDVSPDGSTVVVGGISWGGDPSVNETRWDYATLAYHASSGPEPGEPLWEARFEGCGCHGGGYDWPYALRISPDGSSVYVTGLSESEVPMWYDGGGVTSHGPTSFTTVAYDLATGSEAWNHSAEGIYSGFMFPLDLAVSPDGGSVFVTGSAASPPGNESARWVHGNDWDQDDLTVSIDSATGDTNWARGTRAEVKALRQYGTSLSVSDDGDEVSVATVRWDGLLRHCPCWYGSDLVLKSYETSTGNTTWSARYTPASEVSVVLDPQLVRAPGTGTVFAAMSMLSREDLVDRTLSPEPEEGLSIGVVAYGPGG